MTSEQVVQEFATNLVDELGAYQGEKLNGAHPVFQGFRRLQKSLGGVVPVEIGTLWKRLKREPTQEDVTSLARWAAELSGQRTIITAEDVTPPEQMAWAQEEPIDDKRDDTRSLFVDRDNSDGRGL